MCVSDCALRGHVLWHETDDPVILCYCASVKLVILLSDPVLYFHSFMIMFCGMKLLAPFEMALEPVMFIVMGSCSIPVP
jgi:hypothetical protein